MSARLRLPNRRLSTTFTFELGGLHYVATASSFDGGNLAEIFLTSLHAGSAAGIMASDAAIAASLALQNGCSVEVLRKALSRDARGNAASPLGVALDLLVNQT
jgi:hypothetical protein